MKDFININLGTQTAPTITEFAGRDFIEYGTDDWANTYPQFLIDLYYNSSTHAAIINATSEMISGEDIIIETEENSETYIELQKFLKNPNGKESLHEIIKKLAFDFKLQGGFAINLIWNQERTKIAEIYHIPVERIRVGKPDELGRTTSYWISADWNDIRKNKPQEVPAFDLNDRTSPSQILYTGLYSPNMDIYYTPDYVSCCNWALVDQKVAEFHLSNICNGFSGSYFISLNNGVPTQEERQEIERSIANKFTGASASGKFVLTFSDDKNREPTITPIAVSNADKQYVALQELLVQNIMIGHRVTSPMLLGVKTEGQLGGRDELLQAFEIYQNTVVKPYQEHILKTISKILDINSIALPLSFVQAAPITSKFGVEDMKSVMTQDEIREELGLEPLSKGDAPSEEMTSHSMGLILKRFIRERGEIIDEKKWALISDKEVGDEHPEFDFETELNKQNMLKFNDSAQDGYDKIGRYYKVRYQYAEGRSSSNTRDFCDDMMSASARGIVYTKEAILDMEYERVNAGWGAGGSDYYSIWLYKGGGNCGHYWRRKIYRYNMVEDGIENASIEDADQVVSTTEAISDGFRPESNDQKVSRIPRNMTNNGFIN